MRYEVTEKEVKDELNKIWLDEDEIELQINFIDKKDNTYILNTRAIIEGEAYNNFEVEVKLLNETDVIACVGDVLNLEWDWYDLII